MITFDTKSTQTLQDLRKEEEENLVKTLSDHYDIPYIDLRTLAPEPDALRLITKEEAVSTECIPFKIHNKSLSVALISPENKKSEEKVRALEALGYTITLFLFSHASLTHAILFFDDMENTTKVSGGTLNLNKATLSALSEKIKTFDDIQKAFDAGNVSLATARTSRMIEMMFAGALSFDASDIHIEPEDGKVKLRYRVDGVLADVALFDMPLMHLMNSRLKLLSHLKLSTTATAQDGRFSIDLGEVEIEVRVSIIPGNYGESFVMRLLDPRDVVGNIEDMGMSPLLYKKVETALQKPNGVILTTGPTGSGKSTTLYAFLRKLNTEDIKIITIEDPIEYHLEGITQTQVDEKKEYTFLSGLRSVLRQDPDVIMVGEIRDEDTAKVAINAALTGHLVFSTLHTNNAAGAIPRLIDLKVNAKIIGSALSLSLAQRLVRKLCPYCKVAKEASERETQTITNILGVMIADKKTEAMQGLIPETKYVIYDAKGCEKCTHGYKGRIGIFEALAVTLEIERLLANNPSEREIKDASKNQGLATLREDAIIKVIMGITTLDEVGRVVDLYEE